MTPPRAMTPEEVELNCNAIFSETGGGSHRLHGTCLKCFRVYAENAAEQVAQARADILDSFANAAGRDAADVDGLTLHQVVLAIEARARAEEREAWTKETSILRDKLLRAWEQIYEAYTAANRTRT